MGLAGKRPGRLLRLLFRIPLYLHGIGLGGWERILGIRFVLINTRGRRTGRPHRVLVDVLEHDSSRDVYYIQSAYGMRADWVRNIRANPVFEAQVGRRRFRARVERVSGPQAADILLRYISEHKFNTRTMMRSIGIDLGAFTEEGLRAELEKEVVLAINPVDLP